MALARRSWDLVSVGESDDTEPFSALVELGDAGAGVIGLESCCIVGVLGLEG